MSKARKKVKYPENLSLKGMIISTGVNIAEYARRIGVVRETLSRTVNGHYKGVRIAAAIKEEVQKQKEKQFNC